MTQKNDIEIKDINCSIVNLHVDFEEDYILVEADALENIW